MVDAEDSRVTDETLIGRIAAGDLFAFDRLVRRHQAAVYRFVRAALPAEPGRHAGDAGEILSATFLAARRVAPRHRDETSARPWLLALVRQTIDRLHPGARERGLPSLRELAQQAGWGIDRDGGDEAPEYEARAVELAFAALPADDRELLTLFDREYFTVDETARVTGLSDSAVCTRLHRARVRLLARLELSADGRPPGGTVEPEQVVAGLHCGEVLADLTESLDGRLSRDRAERIDEHLAGCARCRRFDDALIAAVRAVRQLPDEPLPPEVEARLAASLHGEHGGHRGHAGEDSSVG
jgi:RNA polymerase sigma-70 factor (ECF subfamily)